MFAIIRVESNVALFCTSLPVGRTNGGCVSQFQLLVLVDLPEDVRDLRVPQLPDAQDEAGDPRPPHHRPPEARVQRIRQRRSDTARV